MTSAAEAFSKNITGVMVQYYTACKTELWYFANHIEYNDEDENINIGRLIHEKSFSNEKKNVTIDDSISIDYIRKGPAGIVVYEVKKSSKLEEPVRNQVLYYLWYLKQKGIKASAVITYPKERRRETLVLKDEEERNIQNILREIREIIREDVPPTPVKKPYCRRCSYFNICWS